MFLGLLKEENKVRFIELCGYAADADGVFEEKEEATIYTYCREMNIPESLPKKDNTLEEVLDQLKKSASYNEKKIVLFEILGLMLSDEEFAEQEQIFVKEIIDKLEIDMHELERMSSLLHIYKTVFDELYMAVCM